MSRWLNEAEHKRTGHQFSVVKSLQQSQMIYNIHSLGQIEKLTQKYVCLAVYITTMKIKVLSSTVNDVDKQKND